MCFERRKSTVPLPGSLCFGDFPVVERHTGRGEIRAREAGNSPLRFFGAAVKSKVASLSHVNIYI